MHNIIIIYNRGYANYVNNLFNFFIAHIFFASFKFPSSLQIFHDKTLIGLYFAKINFPSLNNATTKTTTVIIIIIII